MLSARYPASAAGRSGQRRGVSEDSVKRETRNRLTSIVVRTVAELPATVGERAFDEDPV